jgi:hypothetical protein
MAFVGGGPFVSRGNTGNNKGFVNINATTDVVNDF